MLHLHHHLWSSKRHLDHRNHWITSKPLVGRLDLALLARLSSASVQSRFAEDSALASFWMFLVRCCPMRNSAIFVHLDQCPHHILEAVAPPTLPSPDVAPLPDPLKQLNSSATQAAANSCLDLGMARLPRAEELGGFIRSAGDNLAKSCVNCWSNGLEYRSHPLDECRWRPIELRSGKCLEWRKTYSSLSGVASIAVVPKRFAQIVYAIAVCSSHIHLDELHIRFWSKASCS